MFLWVSLIVTRRFAAISGMYFSLKYLSFSDAVVLKFMAPILTAISGAVFLKERLSLKEVLAGCEPLRDRACFGCHS